MKYTERNISLPDHGGVYVIVKDEICYESEFIVLKRGKDPFFILLLFLGWFFRFLPVFYFFRELF